MPSVKALPDLPNWEGEPKKPNLGRKGKYSRGNLKPSLRTEKKVVIRSKRRKKAVFSPSMKKYPHKSH